MSSRSQVKVEVQNTRYANEKIINYSSPAGGGLISFQVIDGKLVVELYRHDGTVEIRVGEPS